MLVVLLFGLVASAAGLQKCYVPYGCFTDDPPFTDALVQLPESPKSVDTKFWLYVRDHQSKEKRQKLSPLDPKLLDGSNFKPTRRTVFIYHGYLGDLKEFWVQPLIDELLIKEDYNIIAVDTSKGVDFPYHQAVGNARLLGAELRRMIKVFQNSSSTFNLKDVHCIGVGIGAHICGYLGLYLGRENTSIARITGLDPSGPYFGKQSKIRRLDETDADFVDVIHTDTTVLLGVQGIGTPERMGHVDFYPNGGSRQPSCLTLENGAMSLLKCNHLRSAELFIETINNKQCPSRAYRCDTYQSFADGLCSKCPSPDCPVMGYNAIKFKGQISGKFYLKTEAKKPWCSFHYNIKFLTDSEFLAGVYGGVEVIITGDENVSETIKIPWHNFKAGSTDAFLIHSRNKLGKLVKVKVKHTGYDTWKLYAVVIRPMWTNNTYTGCYRRWLNQSDNEVYLKLGVEGNCPEESG